MLRDGTNMLNYVFRICRMTDLFVNFMQSLRPSQVAVMTRRGGMVFCDADTERMAFGAD